MPNAYLPTLQFEANVITIWKFASIWEVSTSVKHIDCILPRSIFGRDHLESKIHSDFRKKT